MKLYSELYTSGIEACCVPVIANCGIVLILDNGVSGGHVWAEQPSFPVLSFGPLVCVQLHYSNIRFSDVFLGSVLACAMKLFTGDKLCDVKVVCGGSICLWYWLTYHF